MTSEAATCPEQLEDYFLPATITSLPFSPTSMMESMGSRAEQHIRQWTRRCSFFILVASGAPSSWAQVTHRASLNSDNSLDPYPGARRKKGQKWPMSPTNSLSMNVDKALQGLLVHITSFLQKEEENVETEGTAYTPVWIHSPLHLLTDGHPRPPTPAMMKVCKCLSSQTAPKQM